MDLTELKEYMTNLRIRIDEELRNIADEMELLDPASKDYTELDFEFNHTSGQVLMLSHLLTMIEE